MIFWLILAGTLLVVTLVFFKSHGQRARDTHNQSGELSIYKAQLQELKRDLARGVISQEDMKRSELEISRKILTLSKSAPEALHKSERQTLFTLSAALVTTVIAVPLYLMFGVPGYPDLPLKVRLANIEAARAERPSQTLAETQITQPEQEVPEDLATLLTQLRNAIASRPNDVTGLRLLARNEAGIGNYKAAWRAQAQLVSVLGEEATAEDYTQLAELMITATRGYVSPDAEAALQSALQRDPRMGLARYYMGLTFAQGGRADLAFPIWRRLLSDSLESDPWLPAIYSQIEQLSMDAGDPTPLDALPSPRKASEALTQPSTQDVEAMQALTLEERMQSIAGMVEGLSQRLAEEGGTPQEWARLITSLGVLGNLSGADQVWRAGRRTFAGDQGALDLLAQAADRAGLTPDELKESFQQ